MVLPLNSFCPGGPFAMLPMTGHRTNIVWTERSDLAPSFLELEENLFLAEVERRFGTWLGALELEGPFLSARSDARLALH